MSLVSSIIAKLKDIEKHPSGIWLTYRIAYNEEKKDKIIQYLNKTDPPMDFSYQHYGSKEEGHISFRICAYTIDQIMNLNKFLKKEKIKYEATSYDEEYHVKLAYVLATRLVEDLKEYASGTYIRLNEDSRVIEEMLSLIIHGIFNNLHLTYDYEIKFLLNHISLLL